MKFLRRNPKNNIICGNHLVTQPEKCSLISEHLYVSVYGSLTINAMSLCGCDQASLVKETPYARTESLENLVRFPLILP